MKKIIMLAAVLTALATSAFSNDSDNIGKPAETSFNKTYVNAKDVQWTTVGNSQKVTFSINGQQMHVYYRANGEQFAMTRNLLSTQLPLNLYTQLKEECDKQWITELFELSADGETSYFATLCSADQITVLKADAFGSWTVFKKKKRNDR